MSESKPLVDPVGAVVNITHPPQSATAALNSSHTFTVTAQTFSPYSSAVIYQWFKNRTPIPGANSTNYTIQSVSASDDGAKFSVLVAVPGKSATSPEATLTVGAGAPPTIATGLVQGKVVITFTGTLQSADVVTGPYANVPGASPQTVDPIGPAKFYRSSQ